MTADLFAGDPRMEGNDMAGPAGAGPNRWHQGGADPSFPGQPMHQQVIKPCMVYVAVVHKIHVPQYPQGFDPYGAERPLSYAREA